MKRWLCGIIIVFWTCGFLYSQVRGVWSIQERQLNVPKRGVQLIWDKPQDIDLRSIMIHRRTLDRRIHPSFTDDGDIPWEPLVELAPSAFHYTDKSAQVSVVYQYRIVFHNTSGDESDPVILTVLVLNDNPPSAPKGFRVNGFDPMPREHE